MPRAVTCTCSWTQDDDKAAPDVPDAQLDDIAVSQPESTTQLSVAASDADASDNGHEQSFGHEVMNFCHDIWTQIYTTSDGNVPRHVL